MRYSAGKYEFYGYVSYGDGTRLGERKGDQPQFDPAVLTEGEITYLYTGFCARGINPEKALWQLYWGRYAHHLEAPVFIAPSEPYSKGTGFEGYEFFEAPSVRKIGETYYLVYSSVSMHGLCYAVSDRPTGGFEYRGVIVSNCDLHIDSYKPAEKPMFYGGNNHGSIVEIEGAHYVFYHRHTNGTAFSRQGCLEEIEIAADGTIAQVEMTSCGSINKPLDGKGEYPAYLACNLFCNEESVYTDWTGSWMNNQFPKITQDGRDGDEEVGYIANMKDSATAGFKYFACEGITQVNQSSGLL